VLWEEQWHAALEEAWRLHYHDKNPNAAVQILVPLHERMERPGPETGQEAAFEHRHGDTLRRAYKALKKYVKTKTRDGSTKRGGCTTNFSRNSTAISSRRAPSSSFTTRRHDWFTLKICKSPFRVPIERERRSFASRASIHRWT